MNIASQTQRLLTVLDELLETNAPLGVLYHQFLQDDWVAAQLSSSQGSGANTFAAATAVYSVAARLTGASSQNGAISDGLDNAGSSQGDAAATTTPPPTQSPDGPRDKAQTRVFEQLVLVEYILARLYSEVKLDLNPFLLHFVRVYCQTKELRYLLQQVFTDDSHAAGLSSLPVKTVVSQCLETSFDLCGNWVTQAEAGESVDASTGASDKKKNSDAKKEQEPATLYDEGHVGSLSISWLTRVLVSQGLSYEDVLEVLRPTYRPEILTRIGAILNEESPMNDDDTSYDNDTRTNTANGDEVTGGYGLPKFRRHELLEKEGNLLMDLYVQTFNAASPATENAEDSQGDYRKQFEGLVSRRDFSSLQSALLLKLWRAILNGSLGGNESMGGAADQHDDGGLEIVRDAFVDALCTRLQPHRVTNQTADFVYQVVREAHRALDSGNGITSRLVYGTVFRWLEVIRMPEDLLTEPTEYRTSSSESTASSEDQVRLICVVLQSLKRDGVLEPPADYVLLFGQLLRYVSLVPEARELCFEGSGSAGNSNSNSNMPHSSGGAGGYELDMRIPVRSESARNIVQGGLGG